VEKGMMVVSIAASTESLLMPSTGLNHIEINCGESSSKAVCSYELFNYSMSMYIDR
jgi:hypothetical protein